jgi:antagonist of KipI
MKAFQVLNPGFLTTIQDLGRKGFMKYGTPASGVADRFAAETANLLTGNERGAALLEITLFRLELLVLTDLTIAVTGGNLTPTINKDPLPMWRSATVRSGDRLAFRGRKMGFRAYLAVQGGFSGEPYLNSRSVFVRGLMGRPLQTGEILETEGIGNPDRPGLQALPPEMVPDYSRLEPLRVILGPQDDRFSQRGIETFLTSEYKVSTQSDRMGYRLEGPKIEHLKGADIISESIARGAIQVPGDGLPIILLWDAQVSGGYTKIANVISADLDTLAQIMPGNRLRFRKATLEEAHEALRRQGKNIEEIQNALAKSKG